MSEPNPPRQLATQKPGLPFLYTPNWPQPVSRRDRLSLNASTSSEIESFFVKQRQTGLTTIKQQRFSSLQLFTPRRPPSPVAVPRRVCVGRCWPTGSGPSGLRRLGAQRHTARQSLPAIFSPSTWRWWRAGVWSRVTQIKENYFFTFFLIKNILFFPFIQSLFGNMSYKSLIFCGATPRRPTPCIWRIFSPTETFFPHSIIYIFVSKSYLSSSLIPPPCSCFYSTQCKQGKNKETGI